MHLVDLVKANDLHNNGEGNLSLMSKVMVMGVTALYLLHDLNDLSDGLAGNGREDPKGIEVLML